MTIDVMDKTPSSASIEETANLFDDLLRLDDNFSIESLLRRSHDKNLSLEDLRDQLVRHQQDLNQKSIESFNNSYDRFFKLSHIISCLVDPIQQVINPIQAFRDQLQGLSASHDSYLAEINKKIISLEEISRNKLFAERLISLIKKRERIFAQIHAIEWLKRLSVEEIVREPQDDSTKIDRRVQCDAIERTCIEMHYLLCEVRAIQPTCDELIPIRQSLENSIKEQQSNLHLWFQDVFNGSIQSQNKQMIEFVLKTYEQLGDYKSLDDVWRNVIVEPYLRLVISSDDELLLSKMEKTYELLIEFLNKHVKLIGSGGKGVSFIPKSFWLLVTEALDRLEKIYAPDDGLETFRKRYLLTRDFLEYQKNFINNNDGFTHQDSEANVNKIMPKFKLAEYYDQSATILRAKFEANLNQQPLTELGSEEVGSPFRLKISKFLYELVTGCWSPDNYYISSLEDQFSRLACSFLESYGDWLSKLSLSDFRISGTTNFLAKQDAIMQLLIEDCSKLDSSIQEFEQGLATESDLRKTSIRSSLEVVKNGLNNVHSLHKLIQR